MESAQTGKFQKRVEEVFDILMNYKKYSKSEFKHKGVFFDLILSLEIPDEPTDIYKTYATMVGYIVQSVSSYLHYAYNRVLTEIQSDTHQRLADRDLIRYTGGLYKHSYNYFNQMYRAKRQLNLFDLIYNTIVYILQKDCGFHCYKVIILDRIFILISCPDYNLMRAAQKYELKKEVIYSEIDLMLNYPLDDRYRPLRFNRFLTGLEARLSNENWLLFDISTSKKLYRRIDCAPSNEVVEVIQYQIKLTEQYIENYKNYTIYHYKLLYNFYNLAKYADFEVDSNDKKYLKTLLPSRYLYNLYALKKPNQKLIHYGVLGMLTKVKNKRAYSERVTQLMRKYGYHTFLPPEVYTSFFRLNKHKKFKSRLQTLLMFKPLIIGEGDYLGLFYRMERSKLSYLIMQEFLRVENFPKLKMDVFILHNSFYKIGTKESFDAPVSGSGGLDGRNLLYNWPLWKPWRVDPKILRDYLGEVPAFLILLKSYIILYLLIFSPIAIVAYLIILFALPNAGFEASRVNMFFFYTSIQIILIAWLTLLSASWYRKALNFMDSFCDTRQRKSVMPGYLAPYVRNLISDQLNDFSYSRSLRYTAMQMLNYSIVFLLLSLEIVFFYGMRVFNKHLTDAIYDNSFVRWQYFIPVFIFFFTNHMVFTHVLKRLFTYMTKFENNPSVESNYQSYLNKRIIFLVGLYLIGPIDLLLVEPLNRTSCNNSSCYDAFDTFIESRFIVIFIVLVGRFMILLFYMIVNRIKHREIVKYLKEEMRLPNGNLIRERMNSVAEHGQSKYYRLVKKLIKEYRLKLFKTNIYDYMMVLVHISLFSVTLPIAIVINLIHVMLYYYLERIKILHHCRRPINYTTLASNYSNLIRFPIYLFCVVNSWLIFYSFEDWEYVMPGYFTSILYTPTLYNVVTLKIFTAIIWMVLLLLISKTIRQVYEEYKNESGLLRRKSNKLKQYLYNFKKSRKIAGTAGYRPFKFIGRVMN